MRERIWARSTSLSYGHLLQASGIAPRFLAKEAMFRVPGLGLLLRHACQIPVLRGTSRGGGALDAARAALGRGELLMVFPEGTYTRDPDLWPMRARYGAARLALETGAPLLPIASWGGRALWPVGSPLPRPRPGRRLQVRVGEPFTVSIFEGESTQQARDPQHRGAHGTHHHPARRRTATSSPGPFGHDGCTDTHRPEVGRPQPGYRPVRQR